MPEIFEVKRNPEIKRLSATIDTDLIKKTIQGESEEVNEAMKQVTETYNKFNEKLWKTDMHKWWDPVYTDVKQAIALKDSLQGDLGKIDRQFKSEVGADPVEALLKMANKIKNITDRLPKLAKIVDKNDGDATLAGVAWAEFKTSEDARLVAEGDTFLKDSRDALTNKHRMGRGNASKLANAFNGVDPEAQKNLGKK